MNKIKHCIKILSILGILGFTILSCEQGDEAVGYGLLNSSEANGVKRFIDIISYNLYNGDSLRSDEVRLQSAVVGVFEENIFGKVRASYATQIRLSQTNYQFSDSIESGLPKATVDSAVFYFTPSYQSEGDEVEIDTLYSDENGNVYDLDSEDNVDTFRIVTRYPIINKYGDASNEMNLDIHTIGTFLYSIDSTFYSNKQVDNDVHLGQGVVGEYVVGVEYKNSNGVVVDIINDVDVQNISPSVRIPLDTDYFQNNIVNMQGSTILSDQSRFIQFIKGIKVSTPDDNAFILNINPAELNLRIYYSYTNKKDSEGEIPEGSSSFGFNLSSLYNVRVGLYERNALNSPYLSPFVGNSNVTTGDEALYLDGLGGFKTIIQFPDDEISTLRNDFVNNHIAIVGAKLKFYKHPLSMDLTDPTRIFAYIYKNTTLPQTVSDLVSDDYSIPSDIYVFNQQVGYSFNPIYNSENNYYEINLTDYVKNIVEKDSINYPLIVEMGNFLTSETGFIANVQNTNKAFDPGRMVFKGNTFGDEENLKLEILFTEN